MQRGFVDIHCHLLPGVDDGAQNLETTLAMAKMAAADGIHTIIVTPHQLGSYSRNLGDAIRRQTYLLQKVLQEHGIALRIQPGGDVRIEEGMVEGLLSGEVMTLGDHGLHVLLELPHELYFPLEGVLSALESRRMNGILSHPERNQGIMRDPQLLPPLVEKGCLMQVTAGSLMGTFGSHSQQLAEWMIAERLVHFVATDAHGTRSRRPLLHRAFDRIAQLTDHSYAAELCIDNPASVASGQPVAVPKRMPARGGWQRYFSGKKAG